MTAPTLERMKFWIVVPKYAENQIKNPTFASPDFEEDWAAIGAGVTIEETGDEQRWGAYSMKVNPATGVSSGAYHGGLTVANTLAYTFSCYVKGVAGQAMRILISDGADAVKATKQFTATGYWQRVEVTHTAAENAATYRAKVIRDVVASTAAYYVDGAQFEQASSASTFFDGYTAGCRWTGAIRNSTSARSDNTGLGGELLCINDYARVISVHGFGMGDWNQIMTKMTTGGDMYQTHTRKSRNISMVLAYTGDNQGELQTNRKVILDALRPDLLSNLPVREQFGINMPSSYRGHEQRIIRYQGFDANGVEATNPVDIVCVFQPSHSDTPSLPMFQKDVLNFTVPSGLFQGAYHEGKVLDLYANFPAEFIVKRDPQGNWCKWTGSAYASLIESMDFTNSEYAIVELTDGTIASAGGLGGPSAMTVSFLDGNNEWDGALVDLQFIPVAYSVESSYVIRNLGTGVDNTLYCYVEFKDQNNSYHEEVLSIKKTGTTTFELVNVFKGGSTDFEVYETALSPDGDLYIGGDFDNWGSSPNCDNIAMFSAQSSTLSALATGLNNTVRSMAFAPNGNLYIGGDFTDASTDGYGDYLCYWDGSKFNRVGTSELNGVVYSLAFDETGRLYAGGNFTDAGGITGADYIARWNGSSWEPLGIGTNGIVRNIVVNSGKVYVSGDFTTAGGLTLTDRVAVWANGAWQPLDIDLPGTASVYSILPASDGSLYISGNFSTTVAGENAKTGIVALNFEVASASANTYPVISITGPGTLKSIINYRTGKSVMFDRLTLQAGEWVSFNFDPLQLSFRSGWASRGNLMRYVIAGSDYGDFYVSPGANYISLFMDDTDANSKASITYVPKFWGLDGALL